MAFKRVVAGVAIGYVLGAKAGDKRYKELRGRWEEVRDHPWFQQALERGRDFAQSGGGRALGALRERFGEDEADDEEPDDEMRDEADDEEPDDEMRDEADDENTDEDEDEEEPDDEIRDEADDEDEDTAEDEEEDEGGQNDGLIGSIGRLAGQIRD